MFKMAGIACILAGCAGWGVSRVGEERSRVRHLKELIGIIRRIRDEIVYGKHTMPEICLILKENCSPAYRICFQQIYEKVSGPEALPFDRVWKRQTDICLRGAPLFEEEKDILRNMPQNMAAQEEKLQAESIGRSVELLVRNCRRAEEACEDKSKVILSVSLLAGVFIVIMLI